VFAFEALGFDQYSHLMKIYLQRYKDVTKMDKASGGSGGFADPEHMGFVTGEDAGQFSQQL